MTETEDAVAEVWRELLDIAAVGPDDNFFVLGGRSMTAMQAVMRVRKRIGVRVVLADVLRNPVLREFAALVEARLAEQAPVADPATP
jgi:aryl carrier-like protein